MLVHIVFNVVVDDVVDVGVDAFVYVVDVMLTDSLATQVCSVNKSRCIELVDENDAVVAAEMGLVEDVFVLSNGSRCGCCRWWKLS